MSTSFSFRIKIIATSKSQTALNDPQRTQQMREDLGHSLVCEARFGSPVESRDASGRPVLTFDCTLNFVLGGTSSTHEETRLNVFNILRKIVEQTPGIALTVAPLSSPTAGQPAPTA